MASHANTRVNASVRAVGIIDWLIGKPPPDRYDGAWIAPVIEAHAPSTETWRVGHLLGAAVTLSKAGEDGMSKRLFDREIASYELRVLSDREQLYEQVLAMLRRWIPTLRGRELEEIREVSAYAGLPLDVAPRLAELTAERADELAVSETTAPRFAELEAAVLDDPDNDEAWLVLADWLQQQGDPRGELIALDVKGDEAASGRHLELHEAALIGSLEPHLDMFQWKRGYIHRARLACSTDLEIDNARVLDRLLRHASGRLLQELVLAPDILLGEQDQLIGVFELLARHVPPLRSLTVGDYPLGDYRDVDDYIIGDLSTLWTLPRLQTLVVHGAAITTGPIAHPTLANLELVTTELSSETLHAVAAIGAPKLHRLKLWCMYPFTTPDLHPFLARDDLGLDHLGLYNTGDTDALCERLVASPLLPKLKTLDLSPGTLTDAGAQMLAKHADAFARLEVLDVSYNRLDVDGVRAISRLCPRVIAEDQR
jgi:uncharacterized protein (TIGR02996 family)